MPLYEYECGACGHRFEKIQKFADPPVQICPSCGAEPVHKLLSAPAIQFKGTGWYITDYAGKKPGASGSASAESGKTDAAPASKPSGESASPAPTPPATPAKKD